jgi:hypothetical protein
VPSADETAIVVWLDRRESPLAIYAQRLVGDGPVPVAMDLVSAAPASDFVKITGMITDGAGLLVTVYRRSAGGEPASIAPVFPDGTGRIEHVDRDVEPGARYGYHLGAREADREILTREIWVRVPDRFVLGLEPIHPNPSTGALTVAFTLPTPDQASLELLDLAGRRLAIRQVESPGTGRRSVGFPEARGFAPGLYHARLTQGARSLSVKFCVMR